MLETTRPELRDFLCRTAPLRRLCGSLCAAVLGDDRAYALLDEVRRESLFVTAVDADGTWARYHDLFAATLARELERREPGRVPELHLRASAWFEQAGMFDEAIEHALAAGAGPRAAALLARCWPTLIDARRHATVRGVLRRLPRDRGAHGPLCEALDVLCMINEGVDQRLTYRRARDLVARHGDDRDVRRALELVLNSPFAGDVGRAVTLGTEALERYGDDPDMALWLAAQLGMALWLSGARARARALLEPLIRLDQPTVPQVWTLATLAMVAAETDDPERAERYARDAVAVAEAAGAQTAPELTGIHWVLAEALRCAGRLGEARRQLDVALVAEQRRPGSLGEAIVLVLDAQLALAGASVPEHGRAPDGPDGSSTSTPTSGRSPTGWRPSSGCWPDGSRSHRSARRRPPPSCGCWRCSTATARSRRSPTSCSSRTTPSSRTCSVCTGASVPRRAPRRSPARASAACSTTRGDAARHRRARPVRSGRGARPAPAFRQRPAQPAIRSRWCLRINAPFCAR